uniref:Signal recognition particle subunit SRP72 n=1 Tax=Eptatretus burgeri TaxID=7764 RepID=A0A8C4NG38_EPTBU
MPSDVVGFEKAYCEYRLNRMENALKTIEATSEKSCKLQELYGQVLYRLENYKECLDVYQDLLRNSQDDYDEERRTNLSAAHASLALWIVFFQEELGIPENTYELCYNAACTLIGQGKMKEGLEKLKNILCRQSLTEDPDVAEEELQDELSVIHVQMAYVLQQQGFNDEAMQLYSQVVKGRPSDVGPLAVAANNIVTLNKDQNIFDSKKKIKLTCSEGVENKLSKRQQRAVNLNRALLAMHTHQVGCFGWVSALVTLYNHQEDINAAVGVLNEATWWYQKHEYLYFQPGSAVYLRLMKESANYKIRHNRENEAVADLEQLWKQNPEDMKTLAQLISAYSQLDAQKAKKLSKYLPETDCISLKVDVDQLENSYGVTHMRKRNVKPTENQLQPQAELGKKKKQKKKKKGKLPKSFDPSNGPDPERWLPMKERSYYRGKRKTKKKEQIGKGTQGSTTGGAAELDASKGVSSPPASPQPGSGGASNVVPPRQQKPSTAGTKKKAKKKKGGKGGW